MIEWRNAEELLSILKEPFISCVEALTGTSIGVAHPNECTTADEMLAMSGCIRARNGRAQITVIEDCRPDK